MLEITVACVGGLKETYWRDACREYEKRLSRHCALSIHELAESRLPAAPSRAQIESALEEEAALFEKLLVKKPVVVALCVEGRRMTSPELSKKFSDWMISGRSRLIFAVGSSFGISEKLKQKADLRLSMSDMTFPHQMARVMLLEQIYRAFDILGGGKYNK